MTTEYNPYSAAAKFWRDAYLAAFNCGHKDPEAVADEAFLAFESRFGVYTEEEDALCGAQQQATGAAASAGQHMADGMGTGAVERQFGDRLLCGMQQTSSTSLGDIIGAQRDGGSPIGEGPSIEVGDAPEAPPLSLVPIPVHDDAIDGDLG
jgi:hypothetical protein